MQDDQHSRVQKQRRYKKKEIGAITEHIKELKKVTPIRIRQNMLQKKINGIMRSI